MSKQDSDWKKVERVGRVSRSPSVASTPRSSPRVENRSYWELLLEVDLEHQEHISGVNNEPVILTSNTDLIEEAGSKKKIFGQIQNASTDVDAMMNTDED